GRGEEAIVVVLQEAKMRAGAEGKVGGPNKGVRAHVPPMATAPVPTTTTPAAVPSLSRADGQRHRGACQNACEQHRLFLDCHVTTSMVSSVILGGQYEVCHDGGRASFQKFATNAIQLRKGMARPPLNPPCWETMLCKRKRHSQRARHSPGTIRCCSRANSAKMSA